MCEKKTVEDYDWSVGLGEHATRAPIPPPSMTMQNLTMRDPNTGVTAFADFEGASVGEISSARRFEVRCLQEGLVPAGALDRVFYDYNFALGLHNPAAGPREVGARLHPCPL